MQELLDQGSTLFRLRFGMLGQDVLCPRFLFCTVGDLVGVAEIFQLFRLALGESDDAFGKIGQFGYMYTETLIADA